MSEQADKLQIELRQRFPRLKWRVMTYGLHTDQYIPDDSYFLVKADLSLKDSGIVALIPVLIADADAEIIAELAMREFTNKILYDPLDVHKTKLVCT